MNRNLSPQEFEQLELSDMPVARPKLPVLAAERSSKHDVGLIHDAHDDSAAWGGANPIFSDESYDTYSFEFEPRGVEAGHLPPGATTRREWIPTEQIVSPQSEISPAGVRSYAAQTTYPPPVDAVRHGGQFHLTEGNHRVNANLSRGRLLTEANVFDFESWRDTEGW